MATEKTSIANVVTTNKEGNNITPNNQQSIQYLNSSFDGTEQLEWDAIPFEAFGKTTRISSVELSRLIHAAFGKTFHELKGVNILAINNQFIVEMYFQRNNEPVPEGKIINLDSMTSPIGVGGNNNLYIKNQIVQNKRNGFTYSLNNETRLLLSKFMYQGKEANKPNNKKWNTSTDPNAFVREIHAPVQNPLMYRGNNIEEVYLRVTGFDLNRILQELYGGVIITKTVSNGEGKDINYKSTARYQPRFARANTDRTFILNIEQFDKEAVEDIMMRENPMMQNYNGIQMY